MTFWHIALCLLLPPPHSTLIHFLIPRCLSRSACRCDTTIKFIMSIMREFCDSKEEKTFAGARKCENIRYYAGKLLGQWNNYHKHQITNNEKSFNEVLRIVEQQQQQQQWLYMHDGGLPTPHELSTLLDNSDDQDR